LQTGKGQRKMDCRQEKGQRKMDCRQELRVDYGTDD
jgi:hypothetical protein